MLKLLNWIIWKLHGRRRQARLIEARLRDRFLFPATNPENTPK